MNLTKESVGVQTPASIQNESTLKRLVSWCSWRMPFAAGLKGSWKRNDGRGRPDSAEKSVFFSMGLKRHFGGVCGGRGWERGVCLKRELLVLLLFPPILSCCLTDLNRKTFPSKKHKAASISGTQNTSVSLRGEA